MTLWLSMAAMSALAALWLTRPLWRGGRAVGLSRRSANVLVYASRAEELKAEVAAGVLPADEVAASQQELGARLLSDAAPAMSNMAEGRRPVALAIALALLLPLAGALWYWQAGSWRIAERIAAAPAGDGAPDSAEVEQMVATLAARLEANPTDADGFAMLGRSYFVMGRHADAAKAYAKANALNTAGNAEWLVGEGEALALSRDRDLLGRPAQLFDAALKLAPDYGKALWYGSLADAQASDFVRSGERLQRLLSQDLPDDLKALVLGRLEELRGLAGAGGMTAAPQPSAASQPAAAPAAEALQVEVSIAPALANALPANATLFVFAKAAAGPPMPLAVQKLPGAKLPLSVRLDDSMAMAPALKLSQFERYVVTARLSVSGQAIAATGDLEGSAEATRGTKTPVRVEIGRVLP